MRVSHDGETMEGINRGHTMAEGYCLAQSCGSAHAGIHRLIDTPCDQSSFQWGVQDEQGFLSHFLGSRFSCTSASSQDTIHPGTRLISDPFKLLLSLDGTNSKTSLLSSSSHSASFHWNKTSRALRDGRRVYFQCIEGIREEKEESIEAEVPRTLSGAYLVCNKYLLK